MKCSHVSCSSLGCPHKEEHKLLRSCKLRCENHSEAQCCVEGCLLVWEEI